MNLSPQKRHVLPLVMASVLTMISCTWLAETARPTSTLVPTPAEDELAVVVTTSTPTVMPTQAPVPPTETPMPSPTPEPTAERVPVDFNAAVLALDNLSAFRYACSSKWEGTKAGKSVKGSDVYNGTLIKEPQLQWRMEREKTGVDEWTFGKVTILRTEGEEYIASASSMRWEILDQRSDDAFFDDFHNWFSPSTFDVVNEASRSAQNTDVNGISCYEYTYTEKDFTRQPDNREVGRCSAAVNVAVDGGYLVKVMVDVEQSLYYAEADYETGTSHFECNVYDVNKPLSITVPNDLPKPDSETATAAEPAPTAAPASVYEERNETQTIGPIWDSLHDAEFSTEVTLKGVEWFEGEEYDKPKSGNTYVIVQVGVKNLGPGASRSVSSYDFQVMDANGAVRDENYISKVKDCNLESVDLTVGGFVEGCISFEVPTSGKVDFVYAPYKYEGLVEGRYLRFNLRP